ncbi:CAP domain-containing protein [Geodermatophilus sp. DSM 44513]|uniref:CAP domain-containing protein n=1 Tax=Geodermatophilus sp. DSM 44513 TaxID=1528104 RepID=UPI0028F70DF6|nr:CAP domain-containing protein [Geodermatophilus sp. DSM 44513]WNV74868.1 CAP domain-containing protein [Geodermatophilus sp. DSM 44513]
MPAGPPLSSRLAAPLRRWLRLLRLPRVVPLLLVAGAIATVTVGVPAVSGAVTSFTEPVALESTSSGRSATAREPERSWWSSWWSSGPSSSGGTARSDGSSWDAGAASPGGSVAEPLVRPGEDDPAAAVPPPAPAPSAAAPVPVVPSVPSGAAPAPVAGAPSSGSAASAPRPAPTAAAETARSSRPSPETRAPAPVPQAEPTPVVAAAVPAGDPTAEAAVVVLVNQARAAAGCAPVTADPALAAVARAHSADMRDRDYFSHTSPEGLSPFDRAERAGIDYSRAENIAYGQADAAEVVEAWLDSPGHRANILDCDLGRLGVGVAEGVGGPWWTQLFGI